MHGDVDELLRRARDELYHDKVLVRSLRNTTKNVAAALHDSEERLDGLISEIELALEDPHARRRPRDDGTRTLSQAR